MEGREDDIVFGDLLSTLRLVVTVVNETARVQRCLQLDLLMPLIQ